MYQYPYGNAQQLNLDWLMEQWQEVKQSIDGSLQGEIDRVEAAITDLLAARDAAVAAAGAANTSANAAAASAQAAAGDAATAAAQAAAANTARSNAAQAANNAQQYAGNAQTQAAAAQNAAGQAAASANQAAADASDAHDDAVAASGSAVNAAASAAGALQNFQLSDAARQAAQAAEQDAEAAATLLQPPATSADIGKALIVKTVGGGTVTAYELGESGGGGGTPAIVQTIEDVPVASFDDGTVNPVQQLVVDIDPVQAGTGDPAPDNVRPITGWTGANVYRTGVNVWDEIWETGRINVTTGQNENGIGVRTVNFVSVKPNTAYYIKTQNNLHVIEYDNEKNFIRYASYYKDDVYTSGNTAKYIRFYITAVSTYRNDISINLPSTDTEYHAYTGKTYSLTFPTEAGTVYGGTLTNLGEDEWKLIVEWASVDMGSLTWTISSDRFAARTFDIAPLSQNTWNSAKPMALCSIYKYAALQTDNGINNAIGFYTGVLYARDTRYTEPSDFKSSLTGVQLIYKIATPIEYTITGDAVEMLLGINNIWADTGNINLLQYYADSKKYIDEQDTLIKALIAPVLDNMVADTALTANDFRIVDNTLYRITAPIAAGATLTPNTNCTATTIGAILKTLLT